MNVLYTSPIVLGRIVFTLYIHDIVYLGSINSQSVVCTLVLLLHSIAIFFRLPFAIHWRQQWDGYDFGC